jgi:parallel beta-helix repeat protein
VEEGKMKESRQVEVYDSLITKNGWNGIYSRQRIFVLDNNEITDNQKDGVEFSSGSEGALSKNKIKDNGGDGIKLTLDGSKITVKKNSIRDNNREGLEVAGKGESGSVWIRDNKFYKNGRWAIAKISKGGFFEDKMNKGVVLQSGNVFSDNKKGIISPVVKD